MDATRCLLTFGVFVACTRSAPPPEPDQGAAPNPIEAVRSEPSAEAESEPIPSSVALVPSASPSMPDAAPAPPVLPPLEDENGQPLPQTEELPHVESEFFQKSARDLFRAIVEDDPELDQSFFFPVVAYRQVKDIADPERDHERRLLAHFERDVHAYHQKLGEQPEAATFVALRVPEGKVKWMKPGKEGNRIGYHRVLRSSLVYQTADGKERNLEVTSMISWRGEWYVVHLHGFE